MEFYNNNINDKLNFKINIEGIDVDKIEPRLIITNEKGNYLFFGKIKENVCTFDIPELTSYKKGDEGTVKFEIVSEDLYFPVWRDTFEIKTKVSVKIEELYQQITEETKPKISVAAVLEKSTPKKEEKVEEKKIEKPLKENPINVINTVIKEEEEKEKKLVEELSKIEEECDIPKEEKPKKSAIKRFNDIK